MQGECFSVGLKALSMMKFVAFSKQLHVLSLGVTVVCSCRLFLKESAVFKSLNVPCGVFLSTSKSVESVPASLIICKVDCFNNLKPALFTSMFTC